MAVGSALLAIGLGALVTRQAALDSREQLRETAVAQLRQGVATHLFAHRLSTDSSLDADWPPAALVTALPKGQIGTLDDGTFMWAGQRLSDGQVISTRIDKAQIGRQQAALQDTVLRLAGLAMVMSWLMGWFAADRLTSRLRSTALRARRAGASTHPTAVYAGGNDEVAELALAIDDMARAVAQRGTDERAFSADVAHELRTPLTALVTAAELLPDSRESTMVRAQVGRLRTMVSDLLALARLEDASERAQLAELDLGAEVRAGLVELGLADRCLLTEVPPATVLASRAGLRRVLGNLIGNASRHGSEPIIITVSGHALTISDSGPGFPEDILRFGPRRFHRLGNQPGSGLGLTIVLRHAEAMHAHVALLNTDEGAQARIEFALPQRQAK